MMKHKQNFQYDQFAFCICVVMLPSSVNESDFLFWVISGVLMLESVIWVIAGGSIESYFKKFLDSMIAVVKQE